MGKRQGKEMPSDPVAFGEVAQAPPKVTLKRRHWDDEQVMAAHKRRHQAVLQRQMQDASQRLQKGTSGVTTLSEQQQVCPAVPLRHALVGHACIRSL